MAAQGGVGSRIYSFGNTSGGGGGGGGSAAFRPPVEARDSVNALKPTGAVVIDGAPINITGQRVLFTNLSGAQLADNNKVFAATVAAGLVTAWTLQTDGQAGDGNPTDGDNLYVRQGTVNGDREVFYNGTAWFIPAGGANTALSNLTATGINVALVPNATGTLDLGSAPLQWRRINVQQVRDNINNTVLDVNNRILNDSANATALNFSDATNTVIHKNFIPNASGSRDLGSTTAQFRDIFAANLKDASNIVILDMSTRFLGDSAGGPVLDFSNTTNTIFYKNILPSSNNTLSLGSSAVVLSSVWSTNYRIGLLGNVFSGSTPSGTSVIQLQAQSLGGNVGLTTVSNSTPDAVPSGSVYIESGNKTAGTGNSGDIFIRSGTSTGGTRGNLFINVPSLTGSSAGWVWSLQDPATGRGAWAAAAATGANTTLSNLTSPTAINQTLRPDTTHSRDLGTSSLNWNTGYFGITAYSNATLALNGLIRGTNSVQIIDGDTYTANAYFLIEGAGASNNAPILIQTPNRNNLATGRIVLVTGTDVNAAGQKTGDIKFITGDSFTGAGTGPTGDILLKTGVTAGTRGTIRFQDASLATAVVNYVWTLTNITTGAGQWAAAPSPSGTANTVAYFNGAGALSSEATFGFNTTTKSFSISSGTGTLTSTGNSSIAFGNMNTGTITASGNGSLAGGFAGTSGSILSTLAGTMAFGRADTSGIIRSNVGEGGVSFGYASGVGSIISSSTGSISHGLALGGSIINGAGSGSFAGGNTDGTGGAITSSGAGSTARGRIVSATGTTALQALGSGSTTFGHVNGALSQIVSDGNGGFAVGAGISGGQIRATVDGSFARGFSTGGTSRILAGSTAQGPFASGFASGAGLLTSNGNGSHAMGAVLSSGQINSTGVGSLVAGQATGSGQINATSDGSIALGFASTSGTMSSTDQGSITLGHANGSGSSIVASSSGAFATGFGFNGGQIVAANNGAMARGYADGASSLIQANSNGGAYASGRATGGGQILSTGLGGHSMGYATGTSSRISCGNHGALAIGYSETGGQIRANGAGSFCGGWVSTSAQSSETSGLGSLAYGRGHNVTGSFAQAFGIGHANQVFASCVVGQFADATGTAGSSVATEIAFAVGIGISGSPLNAFSVGKNADIKVNRTITAGGVTGDQTIDKPAGTVNFAAAATTLTVTNNLVTIDSIVFAVVRTNDTTAVIKNVVPAAGSFVINLEAAATAETSVGFFVLN